MGSMGLGAGACSVVTLSSHLTIESITVIDNRQKPANTAQHIHCCGKLLSMVTPKAMKRLPMAVELSHRPWQIPWRCLGAIFDTNDRPS